MCVCVFVCMFHPPVQNVYMNHDVMAFQPRTATNMYLGSVARITPSMLVLPPHLFQTFFWIALFPSSILRPSPSVDVHLRIKYFCCARSSPPLLAHCTVYLDVVQTRQPLPLNSAPCTARLHLPPFSASICPPLFLPRTVPRSLSASWGLACRGSIRLPCESALPSLYSDLNPGISWFLVSCQVVVFAQEREAMAPTLPGNHSTWSLHPPAT